MAEYFTYFSCMLDVKTPANVVRALDIYGDLSDEIERDDGIIGFLASAETDGGSTLIWMRNDEDGYGDPEHVIDFVLRCAKALGLTGRWGLAYADTCSKPHLDAFGGGAHAIDLEKAETIGWVSTGEWLAERLAPDETGKE